MFRTMTWKEFDRHRRTKGGEPPVRGLLNCELKLAL